MLGMSHAEPTANVYKLQHVSMRESSFTSDSGCCLQGGSGGSRHKCERSNEKGRSPP